ncbi:DUF7373 family lipoprotein [Mycolicibacterium arseniciresistens]|uniref:Uncharacterized protein n=1 Tax=Mycolicibacterium arseniciresistens TaxID=3062257 RepID=A0ABT8UK07_9MYCO|nr:hypothetical protein [Mycolicibacterium arseniciresistens]MDO3638132.1 hypothetical protein [Mycolicibacterium arseniciresistens]
MNRTVRAGHVIRALPAWLAASMLVTSCAATISGQAAKEPDAPAPPVSLDTGNYPTTPRPPLGAAGPNGAAVEAHRMADAVVGPWEVDPVLLQINPTTKVWREPKAISTSIPEPAPSIASTNGFLTGFSTSRSATAPAGALDILQIAVMRFPTIERAAAAATGMFSKSAATESRPVPVPGPPAAAAATGMFSNSAATEARPVPGPGHPDASAATLGLADGGAAVFSYTARGVFLVYTWTVGRNGNADAATGATVRALDLQKPRLDAFAPTAPDGFAGLPVDPDGVLAKAVPVPPGNLTVTHGAWQPRAALHYSADPPVSGALFEKARVTTVANALDTLYETEDAAGATTLLDGLQVETAREPNLRRRQIDPVPGVPESHCVDNGERPPDAPKTGIPRFACLVAVDRYVASVSAEQLDDTQQRVAAQYVMLTAK